MPKAWTNSYGDFKKPWIRQAGRQLSEVSAISGDEFISEPGVERLGVIAQELQKTNPELVVQKEDGKLAVNYMDMSAYFIGAIQDIQARLLNQEAK